MRTRRARRLEGRMPNRTRTAGLRRTVLPALLVAGAATVASVAVPTGALAAPPFPTPYLAHFSSVTNVGSTVPSNGDQNPYGITVVPESKGKLVEGDTLVSNFNDATTSGGGGNLQGTGTTIVQVSASGSLTTFAQLSLPLPGACPGGVGLTTALAVLPGDWVVVGSLPTRDGTAATAKAGCLIVLDSNGKPVETFSGGGINGPWDMTTLDTPFGSELFVSNVLNGTVANSPKTVDEGTVVRLIVLAGDDQMPRLVASTVVGAGFAERTDPVALVLGPTGLALGDQGQLYVADTVESRIAVIPSAIWRWTPVMNGGFTLSAGGSLNGPLGMTLAPNGDVLTVNGGDGNIVETTPFGRQVETKQIDPAGMAGDLFGVTIAPQGRGVLFVDDGDNTLKLLGP